MVSDVPFTVAVAVLMGVPELLAVGVVPPEPYPLPYLPPLLVDVLEAEGVEGALGAVDDPVLVVLPHAASRTRTTNARSGNQGRFEGLVEVRLRFIACSFLQSRSFVSR